MNVDEILADPLGAIEVPEGGIPLHVIVLVEYANPGSADVPQRPRLGMISDDDLSNWGSLGMLGFAAERERQRIWDIECGDAD